MTEPSDHRWEVGPDALVRRLPDGLMVLTPVAEEPLAIRGPGATLWDLLDERPTFDDVIDDLAQSFGTSPDVVRADIADLWAELVRILAVVPSAR